MKKKICLSIICILIIACCLSALISCNNVNKHNANSITYKLLSDEELQAKYLEEKTDSKMSLAENSISSFSILVPSKMDVALDRATKELKDTLEKMTKASFPITSIKNEGLAYIYIDSQSNANLEGLDSTKDGYIINILDNAIHIKGLTPEGSRNGIYSFIEDYLQAMFLTPEDTYIPIHINLYLEKGNKIYNPATSWRDVYSNEVSINYWASKLKLNGMDVISTDEELLKDNPKVTDTNKHVVLLEERQYTGWGTWCHDFYSYVSPEKYFETHPEYFSLKDGKRIHKLGDRDAHLCLSNPDVYNIISDSLNKKIAANPDAKYWDFSVNDTSSVKGCECKECKALDKAAGNTGMGSLLPVLNKLAKEHPDKYISTLAYFHTIKPPTNNIKLEDNIVIKLCSMPGDQGTSYLNPGNNNAQQFHDLVVDWSKVCNKLVIWDYVVDFANLLLPFPNFAVQQENQKFYEENHIEGIFHQASREIGGELGYLRSYVLSQLMFKGSNMDLSKCVSKYIGAYYGEAASEVIDYFNLLSKNLSDSTSQLGLYDSITPHIDGYLSKENIIKYEKLIQKAKDKVKENETITKRLENLELNISFAKAINPKFSDTERNDALIRTNDLCKENDITMTAEWITLEDFNKDYDKLISNTNLEINKPMIITLSVCFGVFLIITIILAIVLHVKKKKKPLQK